MNTFKKGYNVDDQYQTQQTRTEIVEYTSPDGSQHKICITTESGKADGNYISDKWGCPIEGSEQDKEFLDWYYGYAFGYHTNKEDARS